ncbi:MAG TPA: hypothetical protein ENK18_21915 [Deltaproteobacteria bacterium]|nr:hypothetical protein [Deltaproteobacteria bacterium]
MIRAALLTTALALPGLALACGGAQTAAADSQPKTELAAVQTDATKCAKTAELIGTNCKFSTGQMAQRVHAEGKDTTVTARLQQQDAQLDSHVAAPYTINDNVYVIANEIIEQIEDRTAALTLSGKVLEVDGVTYLLVESYQESST